MYFVTRFWYISKVENNRMSRAKGTPKTGGRSAGTPNKITGTLKEFVANLIDQNRQQIEKDLKRIEPKERLMILERLMAYVLPKQNTNNIQLMDEQFSKIEIGYVESGYKPVSSESEIDLERDKRFLSEKK